MIVKENVTVYRCEHCNKKLFKKQAMELHEKWCSKNPSNAKACSLCSFLKETTIEYTVERYNGFGDASIDKKAKAFQCTKLNKMLYPLKVQKLGLDKKYPETFETQEPMPKECEHFEIIW